jgi:hypothetical protein
MPNPLLQPNMNQMKELYNAMRNGNSMQIFQKMAQNNPSMRPILNMINSGSNPQQVFYQLCQQRGINPDEFIKNITG